MPSALFNVSVHRHIKCAAFTPQLSGLDNGNQTVLQISTKGQVHHITVISSRKMLGAKKAVRISVDNNTPIQFVSLSEVVPTAADLPFIYSDTPLKGLLDWRSQGPANIYQLAGTETGDSNQDYQESEKFWKLIRNSTKITFAFVDPNGSNASVSFSLAGISDVLGQLDVEIMGTDYLDSDSEMFLEE